MSWLASSRRTDPQLDNGDATHGEACNNDRDNRTWHDIQTKPESTGAQTQVRRLVALHLTLFSPCTDNGFYASIK